MKPDGMHPLVEQSARGLGVRTDGDKADVRPDDDGNVQPGAGMSVAPDDPLLLQLHRRPPEYGGTGSDPVWEIADEALPDTLEYAADSLEHGVIEPAYTMPLPDYRIALGTTQVSWNRLP